MFARMARRNGTPAYKDYYSTHPHLQKKDDQLRSLIPLLKPGSKYHDAIITGKARRLFNEIDEIRVDNELVEKYVNYIKAKKSISKPIKEIIIELGGVAAGFTDLDQEFVYSHKGRFDSDYGTRIQLQHPHVIVFLVEMDYSNMQAAPKAHTIFESARQYYKAASISKIVEKIVQQIGFDAKAHYDAHYDLILPPLAIKAGLGELGRNNILIANKYGSRVRIGAISTNIPLEYNKPVPLGADKFCAVCKKCSDNCPSRALTSNGKLVVNGVQKWPTNVEKCYAIWRKYGTDCGICMATCPFSHKNNLLHNTIRFIVKHFPLFNRLMVYLDDLIYGKKWKINDQ